ncbi:hypothetical protein OKJ48_34665 [Streptomyces kunmingensis]|uniref:Uncharacterized protein n=1 Tax=Streptomyces kunmingensis TaxID=68225 RepID=A0ABU6CKS5_9ACTN|nr:hypothetical protein [Streptomyces kunmingensis]MEB3965334.1 hypothetical protein [Streptomyces kunmingensis]
MAAQNVLRLLPWAGTEGKPCYLGTDDPESFMSRLADHVEAEQLEMASELVEKAFELLDDETVDLKHLKIFAARLAAALRDVLRVATSRGDRLPTPCSGND